MWIVLMLAGLTIVIAGFYVIRDTVSPSHDREWVEHHTKLPSVSIDGRGVATTHNVRHARYRSEFDLDLSYTDEQYDTRAIKDVWMLVSHWGALEAHCILSFEFADGRYLAASVEVRKEARRAKSFATTEALYRNFEIFYILADEQDLVSLRTHIWKNDMHVYRLKLTPEMKRATLLAVAESTNTYAGTPQWYRLMRRNCGSEPMRNLYKAGAPVPQWDWRYVAVGRIDRLLYNRHLIDCDPSLSYDDVYRGSLVPDETATYALDDTFSQKIRSGGLGEKSEQRDIDSHC